jgi:hypothetical protein
MNNPGLTLEQARKAAADLQKQYEKEIREAREMENKLGHRRTFPGYTGG